MDLSQTVPEEEATAAPNAAHRVGPHALIALALEALPMLRQASGLYCHHKPFGDNKPQGESVRYSLMVLLGLQTAARAGYAVDVDLSELFNLCLTRQQSFTTGDIGLALWADSRSSSQAAPGLLDQLSTRLRGRDPLSGLLGMEVAWLIIGLANSVGRYPSASAPLDRLRGHLGSDRRSPSGMYYHDASSTIRRHLPNFATEIYTVLALAMCKQLLDDDDARRNAECLADHLLRMQLPDGGWPWLYDADRAQVVERYEVYSVHQDAMAPMAFLELTAVTGDPKYEAAAVRGLRWSTGHNELNVSLLDTEHLFAHRSIRRRRPWNRVALAANAVAATVAGRSLRLDARAVELNAVTRPYHLGWILEAWAGRTARLISREV